MEEKVLKIDANTQPAIQSVADLRKALKAVKDEMVGLEEGSEAWRKLAHQAGEYKHTLDEVNQSIRGASSDFGDIVGNISSIGAGMVGAFQSAKAAMSLFGIESEEVMKSIQTMQNLMAFTQGLTSIDAAIKSFKKLTATVKASTVAMRALNAVMTPKVLLPVVAAIAAITAGVTLLTKNIKAANAEAQKSAEIEKAIIDVSNNAAASYAKQSTELTALLNIAGNEEQSMATRAKACEVLNKKYKNLNAKIDESTGALKYNKQAADNLLESYMQLATGQAAMAMLTEQATKLVQLKLEEEKIQKDLDDARRNRDNFHYSGNAYGEYQAIGEANTARQLASNVSNLEGKLSNVQSDITQVGNTMEKITSTFADAISTVVGGTEKATKSTKSAIDITEKWLNYLLTVSDDTKEYTQKLKDNLAYKNILLAADYDELDSAKKKLEANKNSKEALEEYAKALDKVTKGEKDVSEANKQLYDGYMKVFESMTKSSDAAGELDNLLKEYKDIEKKGGLAVFAKNAGLTREQYDKVISFAVKRVNELKTLEQKAAGELKTDLALVSRELDSVEDIMNRLVETEGEEVKTTEKYLELVVQSNALRKQQDELMKQQFDSEERLAKLRRQANGEQADSMSAIDAEINDVNAHMKKLIDCFGDAILADEEYLKLQVRFVQLNQEKVDKTTEEQLKKIELARLNIDIADEEFYRMNGEMQSLEAIIQLEEERLAIIKERYGEESLEYKQQMLNLKGLKKSLEQVKWASVSVASDGLGYIADMLGSIGDLYDTTTKEGFEKQKKFAIAQTIMNGIAGTINAITSWMSPNNAWMTTPVQAVMAALNSAAIATTTAVQVAQIQRTTFDGGGSVNGSSVGSLTLVPPTEYTSLVQGSEIERNTSSTKQYVAVTEIKEVADRVDVAETESQY